MTEHEEYCVSIRESYHNARPHARRIHGDVMEVEPRNMVVCGHTRLPVRGLQRQSQEGVTAGETGR